MKVLCNKTHIRHHPPFEVFNGDHDTAQEVPERAVNIKKSLAIHHDIIEVATQVPRSLLHRVHDKKYLQFIEDTCQTLKTGQYEYPSIHPYIQYPPDKYRQSSIVAKKGLYIFDTYTPLLRQTYEAAVSSASLAYEAARAIMKDPADAIYALCRPPGHHAEPAMAGGYCYINNAAVAAEYLSQYGKVVVFDIDFHHGNGTQHIFYERPDVFTASIHADPRVKFPFYSGFADETGTGRGKNHNLNLPLPLGTTDSTFQNALGQALDKIRKFSPEFLIVAYGADTHESDPIGGFKLTTPYFTQLAQQIHTSLRVPTMIVQEGGYNNEYLGKNVASFLDGFL